ncbi:MAG: hypothetical protein A2W19_15635 [Spirochaetes bacterium RBG_16_49_21]|nr:MAG: hypothetical protein A2W19_15635 [Spirochaetes bacterium RBG_16_49_21]
MNELLYAGFDVLLALGVNFNIGDYTTIFLDLGIGYRGQYSFKYDSIEKHIGAQAGVGIMLRINDKYQSTEKKMDASRHHFLNSNQ